MLEINFFLKGQYLFPGIEHLNKFYQFYLIIYKIK